MPKDTIEMYVDDIIYEVEVHDFGSDGTRTVVRNILTTAYNKGVEDGRVEERERIENEFAKVAKYTQDCEPDGHGEAVNTSYYNLYEGQWEYIIRPKDTPLSEEVSL